MAVLTKEWQEIAVGQTQYFGGTPGYLILYGKYLSQDIENNTTTYQIDMYLNTGSGYIGNYQSTPYNIQGTGSPSRKDGDQGSKNYYSGYIDSLVTTVTHNNDGTKSVSIGGEMNFTSWSQILTAYANNIDLPTIPRASSLTATDSYIESSTTITINRASSSFTHTITYSFGNASGTIATKTANTSIGWTVPSSFYAQIPNTSSEVCTLTCQTYSGDTLIGTKTTTFIATVNPLTNSPTISGTLIDVNLTTVALTGTHEKLVKYYSTAQITYSATGKNSSTIVSTYVNNVQVTSSPYYIFNISINNFEVKAIDSRGYSSTLNLTLPMIDYIPLTINVDFYRTAPTTGQVSLTFNGNYFNGTFGTETNSLELKWYYKLKTDTNWTTGGTLVQNTDYVITNNTFHSGTSSYEDDIIIGSNFDYRNAYDFKIEFTDELISSSIIKSVAKGNPVFWWNEEKLKVNGILEINDLISSNEWQNITYINTFSSYDEINYNPLQYKKFGNQIFVRGMIQNSVANPSGYYATCGVLPENFRPQKDVYFLGNNLDSFITIVINTNGEIRVFNTSTNWISLDGINFFID